MAIMAKIFDIDRVGDEITIGNESTSVLVKGTTKSGDGGAANYTEVSVTGNRKYVGSAIALNQAWDIETITGTDTLDTENVVAICNSASAFTLNLPAVSGITGRVYYIKNKNIGVVSVDPNGSETIDDSAMAFTLGKDESITVIADPTGWWII